MNPSARFLCFYAAIFLFSAAARGAPPSADASPKATQREAQPAEASTAAPAVTTARGSEDPPRVKRSIRKSDDEDRLADHADELDADDVMLRADRPSSRWFEAARAFPIGLSVLGWKTDRTAGKNELGFGLTLSIPLDATLGPPRLQQLDRGAPRSSTTLLGRTDVSPPRVDPKQEVTANEVRELIRSSWRELGLEHDERLDDLAHRARVSAVLPELRLKVNRTTGQTVRLSPTLEDPSRIEGSGDASMLYEARVTWRLDRLVFADDEVTLERARSERNDQRSKQSHRVIELLTQWRKAMGKKVDPLTSSTEKLDAEAIEAAASAGLDALTGGVWSRQRSERAVDPANGSNEIKNP